MRRGILASRGELSSLSKRVDRQPYDLIYDTLERRCALILEAAPVTEMQWRSLWQQGSWGSALLAARTTQGRILDLLIAHHVKPNTAYRDRAIEELKNLASWSTWVDPCHNHLPADLCTAEAAVGAIVGLDWLWEDLPRPDRLRILQAVRSKAIEPYRQGVSRQVFWHDTYNNWNAVVNGGCGLAALALSDDEPAAAEACRWARKGLRRFFQALGREGGWDEGLGYWGYAMRYLLLFGEALSRLENDRKLLHQRGMDATGLFGIYFTPNGRAASFGDNPAVPLSGTLYLLVKHYGLKQLTWWLDTYSFHRDVSTSGWSAAGLALLFRPTDADCPKNPGLGPLKVFHQIGWAAMADEWPRPRMYVAAKTGDLSANHSQHDMNSIQLQMDGEMLLTDPGAPAYSKTYFSDRRGEFYEVQARAHNTIVVAGHDHLIEAQGSILEAQSGEDYRWVALDSAGACGQDVHFVRHVVMIVNPQAPAAGGGPARKLGETLVVLDELDSKSPETAELSWHSRGTIELDADGFSGVITGREAAVRFALAATVKCRLVTETRKLTGRGYDRALRLSGGVMGRAYIASVFTRLDEGADIELIETPSGVTVKFGGVTVLFSRARQSLRLAKVKRR